MRVDFVITELFVGGAERCLTELVLGLAEQGDFVRVFSLASLPTGQQRLLVDRLEDAGIPVESGGADRPWQYLRARKNLQKWMSKSEADVCQTFLFHANVLGTFAAKAAGIPIRVGGLRVAESNWLRCRLERKAVRNMSSLVCVSDAVRVFATEQLMCPSQKSLVIGNGVDVSQFAGTKAATWQDIGWPVDSIVTLFVGRLHPQKGIDLLKEQIDRIAPEQSRRRLLLVGDGPLREELQEWIGSIGDDRVKLLPWQSDVAPLMNAANVLVLPSRYEGMPNVVLEAMACGKPVVCSKVEGSKEILAHDKSQQGFESGDGPGMAALIEAFLAEKALCDEVGANNQKRVRADFSIPAMVEAYRSHYLSLLDATLT